MNNIKLFLSIPLAHSVYFYMDFASSEQFRRQLHSMLVPGEQLLTAFAKSTLAQLQEVKRQ